SQPPRSQMLAALSLREFIEKTKSNEILGDRLLSANNNSAFIDNNKNIVAVTIVEETTDNDHRSTTRPIAFAALNKCGNDQA
ncbi:hypothetical protein DKP78_24140, partial [Enterococcus faecium]